MDRGGAAEILDDGWRALEHADWDGAHAAFASALAAHPSAEALSGLGQATWFRGDVAESIALREQAFEQFVREGHSDAAAQVGVWVANQYMLTGRASAARGWLSRTERAIEQSERCSGHGWVAVERARHATSVEESAAQARLAMEIGREFAVGEIEVYALSLLGLAEVRAGNRAAGISLLEEAMAAASAGKVRDIHMLGEAYCNLIMACHDAGDWERAAEWCEVVDEFARSRGIAPLVGACRTVHADVLLATGRWVDAEEALETALAAKVTHVPAQTAAAVATMAELRVRQGRLAEAEQLLAGREEHPASLRALALLQIAQNQPRVAAALLERGLAAVDGDAMRASNLLAPLVDARLACEDHSGAETALNELAALSEHSDSTVVRARTSLATARIAIAAGSAHAAAEPARRALAAFGELRMPLDAGEARLELARALALDHPEIARDEAQSAQAAFRSLGASRAMDLAAALLRDLGAGTAPRARRHGELTARELEVLDLLALGMSNARIAQTLVISERTAGHHVSRILSKLGVRNRAEAAAHAIRSGKATQAG